MERGGWRREEKIHVFVLFLNLGWVGSGSEAKEKCLFFQGLLLENWAFQDESFEPVLWIRIHTIY